ncbi:MAG: single-stranded DNA-binding protein [Elusimicrobiota bacterium]|jgi:single-strand DNA-binding protein
MAVGIRLPEINSLVVSGRVVRDAEVTFTTSGIAKCAMRIAVNRRVKDAKSGEWKDDAFYIDVIAWRELAERSKDRAKKGAPIVVEGRLSGREYDDKSGQKRSVYEIVANRIQFLAMASGASEGGPVKPSGAGAAPASESGDLEEVPF